MPRKQGIFFHQMQGKKSFILYCDLIHTVSLMPDDKAGVLFKHILSYVNDENPVTDDLLVRLTFEPIKQSLKRDLDRWHNFIEKQKSNGSRGGRPKHKTQALAKKPKPFLENPKNPMSVSVSVSDSVNVSVSEKEKVKGFTPPTIEEVRAYFAENGYTNADKAFSYYATADWKDSKGNKVKNWKQKMQGVWFKDENRIGNTQAKKSYDEKDRKHQW